MVGPETGIPFQDSFQMRLTIQTGGEKDGTAGAAVVARVCTTYCRLLFPSHTLVYLWIATPPKTRYWGPVQSSTQLQRP